MSENVESRNDVVFAIAKRLFEMVRRLIRCEFLRCHLSSSFWDSVWTNEEVCSARMSCKPILQYASQLWVKRYESRRC